MVAGLDYRRLQEAGVVDSLLFVAHREEILGQSLSTFRHIMRDGSFGELLVGRERPQSWRHGVRLGAVADIPGLMDGPLPAKLPSVTESSRQKGVGR